VFLVAEFGFEELQGNGCVELRIVGLVDFPHPSVPELAEDLVVSMERPAPIAKS
jgi:hypothetical protein